MTLEDKTHGVIHAHSDGFQGIYQHIGPNDRKLQNRLDLRPPSAPNQGSMMRGKAGTAHPGRTAAQRRVLDEIGRGNPSPTMSTSTRFSMLRAGLIVESGHRTMETGFDEILGAIRIAEFAMPPPVHLRWRTAVAAYLNDGRRRMTSRAHEGRYEVLYHLGNPKLCRVTGLTFRQIPKWEGGGWATDERTARIIADAMNAADERAKREARVASPDDDA